MVEERKHTKWGGRCETGACAYSLRAFLCSRGAVPMSDPVYKTDLLTKQKNKDIMCKNTVVAINPWIKEIKSVKTTQSIFVRSAAAMLCLILILCSNACTSSKKPDETTGSPVQSDQSEQTEHPEKKEPQVEFRYSFDNKDWTVPKTGDEPFENIREIPSNSGKIVYFNIENHETTPIDYQLKLTMTEGTAGSAEFGYIAPVQAAYETLGAAVRDIIESKPLDSGYVFSDTLEANQSVTVALVLYCAAGTVGAESRLSISAIVSEAD